MRHTKHISVDDRTSVGDSGRGQHAQLVSSGPMRHISGDDRTSVVSARGRSRTYESKHDPNTSAATDLSHDGEPSAALPRVPSDMVKLGNRKFYGEEDSTSADATSAPGGGGGEMEPEGRNNRARSIAI